MKNEGDKEKQMAELEECTFTPDISQSKNFAEHEVSGGNSPIYSWNEAWSRMKEDKIQRAAWQKEEEDLSECTFQPRMERSAGKETPTPDTSMRSIEKHLDRMYASRANEIEKQHQHDSWVGSGKHWTDKLTVPREPNLKINTRKEQD